MKSGVKLEPFECKFVLGFTEVLTVYFSVKPGQRQDDQSRRIRGSREDMSRRKGCHQTVGESGVNKSGGVIRSSGSQQFGTVRRSWNRYTGLQWNAIYLRPYIYLVTLWTYLAKCFFPPDWIADPETLCVSISVGTHFSELSVKSSSLFVPISVL